MQEKLSLEDKKKLQTFANQAQRLSLCKFFENGKRKRLLMLGDQSTKAIVAERQVLIEMLTILRPFIMHKEYISFNTIVSIVRKCIADDTLIIDRLKSVQDEFNFYKENKNSNGYQKKYSNYISQSPDITCDFGNKTIFEIIDLVINGYYFHSDLGKQKEIINFVKEQQQRWLYPLKEDDLSEKDLILNNETIREAFKFRFEKLVEDIANCIFALKDLIEEVFGLPLDKELEQQWRMLYDFFDI